MITKKIIYLFIYPTIHPSIDGYLSYFYFFSLMDHNLRLYKRLNLGHQLFLLDLDPNFFTSVSCFYGEVLRAWMTSGARIEAPPDSRNFILNLPLLYPPLVENFPGGAGFCARLWTGGVKFVRDLLTPDFSTWLPAEDLHLSSPTLRPPSLRLLRQHLSRLHRSISSSFPALFNDTDFVSLQDISSSPPVPPGGIFVEKDTDIGTLSTKAIYCIFNYSLNPELRPILTPWHGMGFFPAVTARPMESDI